LQLINPSTSPNELNTTLTPHSIIHGDACFAYFNKIWDIPIADVLPDLLLCKVLPIDRYLPPYHWLDDGQARLVVADRERAVGAEKVAEEKALDLVKICCSQIPQELEGVIGEARLVACRVVHDAVVSGLACQMSAQPPPNTIMNGFAQPDIDQP